MKFQLKKSDEISGTSALAPNTSYLEFGEIVVNYNAADPKLFFKLSDNSLGQIGITTIAGTPTTLEATGSSAAIPKVVLNRSQGTVSSPSDLVDGNTIGSVVAKGYYSGSYTEMGSLNWLYDYTSGSNTGPGSQFEIKTSVRTNNSNTFNTPATRFNIDENGNTRIGGNLGVGLLGSNPPEKITVYNGGIYSETGYKFGGSSGNPNAELSTFGNFVSRLQIKVRPPGGNVQEVACINDEGIGFGTTGPTAAFHGYTANETLGYFHRSTTGNVVLRFRNTTSNMYCGLTTNATGFAIDDDSNLGDAPQFFIERTTGNIGVNAATPARKFVVDGGADNIIGSFLSTDSGSYISFSDNATSSDSQVRVGAVGNEMVLQSAGSSTLRLDASSNARFFGNLQVDGSGGISTPALTVNGTAVATQTDLTDGSVTKLANTWETASGQIHAFINDGGGNLGMRFNAGAHTPTLVESGSAWQWIYSNDATTGDLDLQRAQGNAGATCVWETQLKNEGSDRSIRLYYQGNEKFKTTSAGATVTGAFTATGDITAFSDISLKENIEVIPNALEKIHQIRGITYKRKDIEGYRQAGVIAQEVEKVLPEVVHDDPTGIKSVAYGNLVSLLIEAVKEQQSQIEALIKRVNQLENN